MRIKVGRYENLDWKIWSVREIIIIKRRNNFYILRRVDRFDK